MFHPACVMPLFLALLMGGLAAAQPAPPEAPGVRHIELAQGAGAAPPEVIVSPGLTSAFRFHGATLEREGVTLQGSEQVWLSVAEESILLVPSDQAELGQRLRLTVTFHGGEGPPRATFILVVQSEQAERQVEVYRQPRRRESWAAELRRKDAQLQSCQEQVNRLRAASAQPGGLTGLIAAGALDKTGIISKPVKRATGAGAGASIRVRIARSFRSVTRVAVELWLDVPEEAGSWKVERVLLRGGQGGAPTEMTAWEDPTRAHGTERRIVVEAAAPENAARFTLELWGEGGRRAITLEEVTFP